MIKKIINWFMGESFSLRLTRAISIAALIGLLITNIIVKSFPASPSDEHIRQIVRDEIAAKELRERMAPIQADAELKQKEADLEKEAAKLQEQWNKIHGVPSSTTAPAPASPIPASPPPTPSSTVGTTPVKEKG